MKQACLEYIKSNNSDQLRRDLKELYREYDVVPISYRQYDDTNDLVKCACQHKHLQCLEVLMEYNISPLYPWDAIGPDFILDAFLEQDAINMCPHNYQIHLFQYGIQTRNQTIIQHFVQLSAKKDFKFQRKEFFKALLDTMECVPHRQLQVSSIIQDFLFIWLYLNDDPNLGAPDTVCTTLMMLPFDMFVMVLDDVLMTVLDTKLIKVVDGPYCTVMDKIKHLIIHAVVAQQYKKVHYLYCCLRRNKYYSLYKEKDLFSIAIRDGIHTLQTLQNAQSFANDAERHTTDPIHDYAYLIGFKDQTDISSASCPNSLLLHNAIFRSIQIANMDLLAFTTDKDIRKVVNQTMNGWTPLMFACINDSSTMIAKLIQCGADVNASNGTTTALSLVVRNRNEAILKWFLRRCFPHHIASVLKHKNSPFAKLSKFIVQNIASYESPIVKISQDLAYVKQNSSVALILSTYRNSTAMFL